MDILTTLQYVFLFGALVLWVIYLVEAFSGRFEQGLLALLVPGYVLYYAYVRSTKGRGYQLGLMLFTCAFVLSCQ